MPKPSDIHSTRRQFVNASLGVLAVPSLIFPALAAGAAACSLTPEQEVGPYYVKDELLRTNIAENKPGVPLSVRIVVLDSRTCQPLPNAAVDVWHCDAVGLYSGFTKQNPQGPGGPPPHVGHGGPPPDFGGNGGPPPGPPPDGMGPPPNMHPSDKLTFLRGIQITDKTGAVQFDTIFPGFYMGRTNHIHFKVRLGGDIAAHTYNAGHTSHTGQIFFPEDLSVKLMARGPYSEHKIHRTTQAEDMVFGDQNGQLTIARITSVSPSDLNAPLHAELIAAVDPTATPGPAQRLRRGPPAF